MKKKGMNKMMKEMKTGTYTYNDESYNFNFATDLSANEKRIFVRSVVGALVDGLNYDSVLRGIVFDYTAILMFTDIDMSFIRSKDEDGDVVTDMEVLEEFLLGTNIVDIIKANAFPTLFEELNHAVDLSIQYRTGINPSPLSDSLSSLLSTLEKKINEVDLDSMMGMAQKFASMGEDFTMENLVKTYMNSDIHKKNLEEIAEVKESNTGKSGKKTKKDKVKVAETEKVIG
jgi:hypothetical protein